MAKVKFQKHLISRQWRWKITADNGKIIACSSESFHNKKDCEHNFEITGIEIEKHLSSNFEKWKKSNITHT